MKNAQRVDLPTPFHPNPRGDTTNPLEGDKPTRWNETDKPEKMDGIHNVTALKLYILYSV